MSTPLVVNGVTYDYPEVDDTDWGSEATDWATAVTVGMLQKAGGLFQLLAEVDFGTAYGIKSLYLKSRTANPADAGQIRLARADVINWRNQANNANLSLGVSSSNVLQFDGADIQGAISVSDTATIDLTFTSNVLSADIKTDSITNAMINSAAAIAYSKLALTGSIVNADINASAAIAYSKLNLSSSIVNSDINASAAIAYSKLALTGSIVNADVNASAAIAFTKLAGLTDGNILVGSAGNVATSVAMAGDVTIINTGATAIGANKVTNAQLAQIATARFKGRTTGSTGDVEDLTATQATALLNNFVGDSGSGGTKGLVPAPASGDAAAGKFLKADGGWTVPAGAGDVTGPGAATDNALVRFDSTTGKVLKNSVGILGNTGNLTGIADFTMTGNLVIKTTLTGVVKASSGVITAATLVNADVDAAAAIAVSKLAAMTASRAVVSDGSGFISPATTTATEIGYVNGVTSAIQTQLDAKQLRSTLTAKGDLYVATASNTVARQGVGNNGQLLVADSTQTNGWSNVNPLYLQNLAVNGAFDYWQAAPSGNTTTITATGGGTPTPTYSYCADQWYVNNVLGGGTVEGIITYSRATGVTNGSRYGASVQITTAPTGTGIQNGCELYTVLSNQASYPLYNQTASFSILVKAFNNVTQVGVQFFYGTTEVKPTNSIGAEVLTTVNASTFVACTINGQALGTSQTVNGVIGVRIRPTAVSSGNLYSVNNGFVAEQAMLNLGPVAMPFQRMYSNPAPELAACQYFYEKSYDLTTATTTVTSNGQIVMVTAASVAHTGPWAVSIPHKVSKRVTPTVTIYSPTTGTAANANLAGTDRATNAGAIGLNNFTPLNNSGGPLGAAGNGLVFHFSSDARI